jgi:hypothetical protein
MMKRRRGGEESGGVRDSGSWEREFSPTFSFSICVRVSSASDFDFRFAAGAGEFRGI